MWVGLDLPTWSCGVCQMVEEIGMWIYALASLQRLKPFLNHSQVRFTELPSSEFSF